MSYTAVWACYVPRAELETYRQIWREAIPFYLEHGTRQTTMLMPVDVTSEKYGCGPLADALVGASDDDTVLILGVDVFDSREQADAAMDSLMGDERFKEVSDRCIPIFGEDMSKAFLRGEYTSYE